MLRLLRGTALAALALLGLAEAKKIGLDIDPMGGEEMSGVIRKILATRPAVVDGLRAMLAP